MNNARVRDGQGAKLLSLRQLSSENVCRATRAIDRSIDQFISLVIGAATSRSAFLRTR